MFPVPLLKAMQRFTDCFLDRSQAVRTPLLGSGKLILWYFLSSEASSRSSSQMSHMKPGDSFWLSQQLVILPYLIWMCLVHTLISRFFEMRLNINSGKAR